MDKREKLETVEVMLKDLDAILGDETQLEQAATLLTKARELLGERKHTHQCHGGCGRLVDCWAYWHDAARIYCDECLRIIVSGKYG